MEFNLKKCHVLEMGVSKNRPHMEYKLGNKKIETSVKEKDLGVTLRNDLSPEYHINNIVKETYWLLNRIKIAFNFIDEDMLEKMIKTLIRPRLEYAAVVWSPHLKKHILKLERVQRAATRLIPELRELSYERRLEVLNLTSLEDRRERGDMITLYKCVTGLERVDKENFVVRDQGRTRGHSLKLKIGRCKGDVRKFSFPFRSLDKWNKLQDKVVRAKNVHTFKEELDKCNLGGGTIRA